MRRLPLVIVVGLVALALVVPIAGGGLGGPFEPGPTQPAIANAPDPTPSPAATATPATSPAAPPTVAPTPAPTETFVDVPVVPVGQFRTTVERVGAKDVRAVLDGRSGTFDALELVAADADAILAALGAGRPADTARLVEAPDVAALIADLSKHRKRLAFLRADEVAIGVRALGWEAAELFGVDRATDLAGWPLTARLSAPTEAFNPATTWTLVAAGDMLFDRGVARQIKVLKKGVDFPFDGGTAEITGHTCCSGFGHPVPRTKRTGNKGAVRDLLSSADLAIANLENPAPKRFTYHTKGVVFSADPKLLRGVKNAGIDWVSLANNHIRDAGARGITETIDALEELGIEFAGAGRNLAAARDPSYLEVGDTTVAVLAYDAIARYYAAGEDRAGSAQLSRAAVREDIRKARAKGADVVIVFPHWGTEYRARPFENQQRLARAIIEAGADMIIGNHAHWAGAVEVHRGKPIWYALGNFVFDQDWSEPTMEGMTLELTFRGPRLVQAWMHPHVIVDEAQPNFLAPAGDGQVVLKQVYGASKDLLPW